MRVKFWNKSILYNKKASFNNTTRCTNVFYIFSYSLFSNKAGIITHTKPSRVSRFKRIIRLHYLSFQFLLFFPFSSFGRENFPLFFNFHWVFIWNAFVCHINCDDAQNWLMHDIPEERLEVLWKWCLNSQFEIKRTVKVYLFYAKQHDAIKILRKHIEMKLHLRVEYEISNLTTRNP